jgi:hypothetical protein
MSAAASIPEPTPAAPAPAPAPAPPTPAPPAQRAGHAGVADALGTAPAAPPGAAPPSPWSLESLSEEDRGYATGKSWKSMADVINNFRTFEKARGYKTEQMVILPEKEDSPEWRDVWSKLGAPEKPEEYDLGTLPADDELGKPFRELAHKMGLPKAMARQVADWFRASQESQEMASAQAEQFETERDLAALKQRWGDAFPEHEQAAASLVAQAGLQQEEVESILGAIGVERTYTVFAKLGLGLGEHRPPDPGAGVTGGQRAAQFRTPEYARNRIEQLMNDKEFTARRFSTDPGVAAAAVQEWQELHAMIHGQETL